MLTLNQLKDKYGRIFQVNTPKSNLTYYFRLLSKREYDLYVSMARYTNRPNIQAEDYLIDTVCFQQTFGIEYAGERSTIVTDIIQVSGFNDFPYFVAELKKKRIETNTLIEQMMGFISKAFPVYKIEDLENMNYQQLARLLALSEIMMGNRLEIPGAEIEDDPLRPLSQEPEDPHKGIMGDKIPVPSQIAMRDSEIAERTRAQALEVLQKSRVHRAKV